MYNPIGVRQLNAFAARAMLRLPEVPALDRPTERAAADPACPPSGREPQAPVEP